MDKIFSGPVPCASARPAPPPGVHPGDVHRLRRYYLLAATSSSFATDLQTSKSTRSESSDALRDAVIALIHAVNGVLNEELESAAGSVRRSAELLHVNACVPEFSAITKIASVARGGLAPWQARIVKTHIDTHLDGNLRTKNLARLVQLSSFHFCRVFRVSFGYSPHTYVTRRRLERAQGLILTTNRTLTQIALDCGFADQAHFTKIFRRSCGESPGEWRRTRMGGTNEPTPRTHSHSRNLANTAKMISTSHAPVLPSASSPP
jgi:AraC family transcriptional regulator